MPSSRSGFAKTTVTRACSIVASTVGPSVAGGTTTAPPANNVGSTVTPSPPIRVNGAAARVTSADANAPAPSIWITFQSTLAWESITPFGRPVVPEVYARIARSPGSGSHGRQRFGREIVVREVGRLELGDRRLGVRPRLRSDQESGLRVVEHGAHLVVGPGGMDRHPHSADRRRPEQGAQRRRIVATVVRHPITGTDPATTQHLGHAANIRREIRVRAGHAIDDQRHVGGRRRRASLDPRPEARGSHGPRC